LKTDASHTDPHSAPRQTGVWRWLAFLAPDSLAQRLALVRRSKLSSARMPSLSPAPPSRLPALDGLRAIAALAVVLEHGLTVTQGPLAVWRIWAPGPAGVRLFFVLSGVLITGVLVKARDDAAAAGVPQATVWRAFILRRALRIFPLAYLALAIAWIVGVPAMRDHPGWYLTYASNLEMAWDGHYDPGLVHFWSLAVEEQFYVVWPLLLWIPPRWWRGTIWTFVIGITLGRLITAATWGPWPTYMLPWTRMDALAFGGLLAISTPRLPVLIGAAATLTVIGMALPGSPLWVSTQESAAILWSGAVIVAVIRGYGAAVLTVRPLRYLGTISYGLYVWHALLPQLAPGFPPEGSLRRLLAMAVGGVALASLSWYLMERPLNDLKRYFPYVPAGPRSTTPSSASVGTALCADASAA
jgi:peptidoglycan/LPS O-acetylase OafA/YrhL